MKSSIKSIVVLVAICTILTVLLAVVNSITAPIIAENQKAAANAALLEVMPEGKNFEAVDISAYELPATVVEAHKEEGGGFVIQLVTTGYGADFKIICGVRADGTVSGAKCLSSTETLGKEKTYGENFTDKNAEQVAAVEIISGATKTTQAYKDAIRDAINASIILAGGSADLRTEEQIFADNLAAALPTGNGEFIKKPVFGEDNVIDFVYAAKNESGYVYVTDKTFVGINADGEVLTEGLTEDVMTLAKAKAELAKTQTTVDTADSGINKNITMVQKSAEGNYIISINGIGFAYLGDDSAYQPARNIPIEICVVISPEGTILKCLTVAHEESGGYGAVCGEESYYSQFDGKNSDTYKEVDGISGATITTNGYMKAIERAFEAVSILEGGVANEE
ncbi:MAG: FMN-binding protein [Clostridia bacterium]|nr:FMN-binding protein [Clostridia bacterium]